MSDDQVTKSQNLVAEVFREVRPALMEVFGKIEFTRKQNFSPVTEWDVRVEEKLRRRLEEEFPHVGFQGEETGHFGNTELYWLVDPIDGTSSFVRGLEYSTNMAALVYKDEVVAAVIYDFVRDRMYTARKGQGAYMDGEHIHVNTHRRSGDLLIHSLTRTTFPLIREALHELGMRTLLPMGAAGHSYILLAEGKIDGVVVLQTHTGLYDNAPGVLIAEEAGAQVLSYDDKIGVHRHEFIIGTPFVVDAIEKSGLI